MLAYDELIEAEGWKLKGSGRRTKIVAYDQVFPYVHPFSIHGKLFRIADDDELRYLSLRAMHRYAWPQYQKYWNYWDERRFRTMCQDYNYIAYAGGAHTGKSHCAAMLAILTFLAEPEGTTVIVASTTLAALSVRIWGYVTRLINEMQINFPIRLFSGNSPRILYNKSDPIHGMYAVAAGKGTDEKAISNWIGRHPKQRMVLILDEATDLNPVLLTSLPNLESGGINFTCLVIGNSLSRFDLHGSLSTPLHGWKSINPLRDNQWPTTQNKGTCLFFSCYESPAIHETDYEKKQLLSKIFITQEQIESKERLYGKQSDSFWRFVLGFWRDSSTDETVIDRKFLDTFDIKSAAEWSGVTPIQIVGGLDPAFSQGGDQAVLRLAVLGHDVNGNLLLDYRGEELLFRIPIIANHEEAAEVQIAKAVINICMRYNCPIQNIAVDSNGQGRAIGEVIRLHAKVIQAPMKIYSVRQGNTQRKSFDVIIKTNYELWAEFRNFIQTNQIRGLDSTTIAQITTRRIEVKNGKQILETKREYKTRMSASTPLLAHSPDEADAAALALQSAIIRYQFTPGQGAAVVTQSLTDEKYDTFQRLHMQEQEHNNTCLDLKADYSSPGFDAPGNLLNVFGNILG